MEHAAPPSPATGNPHYNVKRSVVIAQSDTMRVIDITLAPGECIPWHLHPDNEDYVIVLNGTVEIREYHPDKTVTLGPLKGVPKGVYAYAFRRLGGGKIVTALWTHDNDAWSAKTGFDASRSVDYRLRVDAPGTTGEVTVFDMMGNATAVPYRDGVASLKLSPAPVYVVSDNADVFKEAVTTPEGYVAR